jgi:hypothetical protein
LQRQQHLDALKGTLRAARRQLTGGLVVESLQGLLADAFLVRSPGRQDLGGVARNAQLVEITRKARISRNQAAL